MHRSAFRPLLLYLVAALLSCQWLRLTEAVKHENFKTCAQSGFCARNRALADAAAAQSSTWRSPYRLDASTLTFAGATLRATVLKTLADGSTVRLPLTLSIFESGVSRLTLDEERRQKGEIELRHGSAARRERYNEADRWALVGGTAPSASAKLVATDGAGVTRLEWETASGSAAAAIVRHEPFGVEFQRGGETHVAFNRRGLLNVEHWRPKTEAKDGETKDGEAKEGEVSASGEDESTWWEESFGGNTDSKPRGPESVGLDVAFPGYGHVFGIPEHTGPLSLKETRGGEGHYHDPYRLYNTDVFEYELDSPMTLYGAIPLMQAHRAGSTVGVLWLNAAETWIDITKTKAGQTTDTHTHWFSEAGLLDAFVFLGPTPRDLATTYTGLTGLAQLPPLFSIAYHQCRWNYMSDEEVADVDRRFDSHAIPYDVIWLDLEYTDDRKYFTWNKNMFPDPAAMQAALATRQRKLVTLIDPHIKSVDGYFVNDQLKSKELYVRNKEGKLYDGWCWPGASHWVDCFAPAARAWWAALFQYATFPGSTPSLHIWNDMNEPSVFNGPETTMPKDNLHHGGWEHRDLHNLNGLTFVNATFAGLLARDAAAKQPPQRPFVLTRSFYAGGQRTGALWTGDNLAEWGHLAAAFPMLLSLSVSGFGFTGADVGGFFGNPGPELLARWYQAGAFYPFFRAHAHIDTRRREPYLAAEPYRGAITQAIRLRYQLLPAWYTAFRAASIEGTPLLRPWFYAHPAEPDAFLGLDDQFYVGGTGLLAKPVVQEGATSVSIRLADNEPHYDYFDFTLHTGPGSVEIAAPLAKVPLLMRGGHIFARRDRPRRSSALAAWDPYTLVVALDKAGTAEGELYVDDGAGFDYEKGARLHWRFRFDSATGKLKSEDLVPKAEAGTAVGKEWRKRMAGVSVERVVVVGVPAGWKGRREAKVKQEGREAGGGDGGKVELRFHEARGEKAAWAVVRRPGVSIAREFEIKF